MSYTVALVLWIAALGGETLETTPTIHCCGIRVRDVGAEIAGAKVRYRPAGQDKWNEALPLAVALGNALADKDSGDKPATKAAWIDAGPIIRRLHGSIFYLRPDTSYEVEATLLDAAGKAVMTLDGRFTTAPNEITYGRGRTLRVGRDQGYPTITAAVREARAGDTVLVSPGVYRESVWLPKWPSGERGNPITLRAEKGAILDGQDVPKQDKIHGGIHVEDAHDLVVEGFLVRRFGYAMFLNTCQRVVIQRNCIDLTESERSAPYGIRMKRCRDCLLQFNSAREPMPGEHQYALYPFSIDAGRRNVVRYNRMLGGACLDILTARNNSDTDIYENDLRGIPADDGAELEGGVCINLRFFNNLLDCRQGSKATLSTTPVTVGPVYVVRNVFVCARQVVKFANDGTAKDLKAGHKFCDFAPLLFYHNTFCGPKEQFFRFLGSHGRLTLVNNLVRGNVLPNVTASLRADRASNLYARVEADYNLYWDGGKTTTSRTPALDRHSVFAAPLLVDLDKGDFHLRGQPGRGPGSAIAQHQRRLRRPGAGHRLLRAGERPVAGPHSEEAPGRGPAVSAGGHP